ncbi:MAG: TerB family tellurite resistance protein [Deltaproteobacteria bacterium]|nr:TerB family tellurite resistance protein [Deltaproteobacteria bacterium]MCW5806270.1 TerB family tellurite resistance protein [Deltaproteobacteria bacterium]
MSPNVAKCLVVSKVLVADGMMTDDERAFLGSMMDSLALSPAERQTVIDLEGLDEAESIVRGLSADERREIVALLIDAAAADGRLSPHELETAKKLTAALGLD